MAASCALTSSHGELAHGGSPCSAYSPLQELAQPLSAGGRAISLDTPLPLLLPMVALADLSHGVGNSSTSLHGRPRSSPYSPSTSSSPRPQPLFRCCGDPVSLACCPILASRSGRLHGRRRKAQSDAPHVLDEKPERKIIGVFCGIRVEFINEILGCLGEEEGYAPCSSLPWFPTTAAGNIPTPDAEIHASGSIFLNVGCLSDLAVDLLLAAACALFPPSSSLGSVQPRPYYRPQYAS